MSGCRHRAREIAPTVLWCSVCGAHRRLEADRWTRWVPAGVRRLRPIRDRKQLELELHTMSVLNSAYAELVAAVGDTKPTLRLVK